MQPTFRAAVTRSAPLGPLISRRSFRGREDASPSGSDCRIASKRAADAAHLNEDHVVPEPKFQKALYRLMIVALPRQCTVSLFRPPLLPEQSSLWARCATWPGK